MTIVLIKEIKKEMKWLGKTTVQLINEINTETNEMTLQNDYNTGKWNKQKDKLDNF